MNRLSVIIPVYNAEAYLDECIQSITGEMQPDDEIILINDGSKDSSLAICRKYAAQNIRIIDNTNHGVSYSRNCGIAQAQGDYITFVDSDDYLLPGWRDTVGRGMDTGCDVVYFSKSSDTIPEKQDVLSNILCYPVEQPLDLKASACWNKLFRCEFIKDHKIAFDPDIINGEDGIFSLQAFLAAASYTVIQAAPIYFYRVNNVSATHSFNPRFNTSNLKYIQVARASLTDARIVSADQINAYMNYIIMNGLYILALRISLVDDRSQRRSHYPSFRTEEYEVFYQTYVPNHLCRGFKRSIYELLKARRYDTAMRKIRIRRSIFTLIKKVLRKKNGF